MNEHPPPAGSAGDKHPRDESRGGFVDPAGSEATRELRGMARRRRESEEKLQHHLQESKEHLEEKQHADEQDAEQDPEQHAEQDQGQKPGHETSE